ncbi:MAG: mononuclear molybdenum enzyme YedY, partial [Byssovorax sp.]
MARLPPEPPSAEITPEALHQRRREFLKNAALFTGTAAAVGAGLVRLTGGGRSTRVAAAPEPIGVSAVPFPAASAPRIIRPSRFDTDEPQTTFEDVTH